MDDLQRLLTEQNADLSNAIKNLRKSGEAWAQKERDYQIAKSQAVLIMKDAGCTMKEIDLRIKGEVAEKLFERDMARVFYDSNLEYINVAKKQLQIIENQIQREWSQNG